MASERSEDDPLFMKLTKPQDIWKVIQPQNYGYDIRPLNAFGLKHLSQHEIDKLAERGAPSSHDEHAWVYREAVRMQELQRRVEFRWEDLALVTEGGVFWRWCLAPAFGDSTKIRYTPSAEYGKADRQIVTTLGKFLTKHYADALSADQIREWQNAYASRTKPLKVLFADTPDEVEHVYRRGPVTCMTSGFSSSQHPARLWGYCADTAVAYAKEGNEIIARCLVRKSTKAYIRVYPDRHPRMTAALEALGYKYDGFGCYGLRVPLIADKGGVLMPYCDGAEGGRVEGNEIVLGDDGFDVQETEGLAYPDSNSGWTCPRCAAEHGSDDASHCSDDDETYCDRCEEDFVCALGRRGHHVTVHRDRATWIECLNEYVLDDTDAIDRAGVVQVERYDDFYRRDDCVRVDGQWELEQDCTLLDDGTWVLEDDAVQNADGVWVRREEEKKAA